MAKQQKCHKYVYKIHSSALRNSHWKLELPLTEAIVNKKDIIALTSSQMLRWIDELRGRDTDATAKAIKNQIKKTKKQENTKQNQLITERLYKALYTTQFCPDYLSVIMNKYTDYDRLNKGFTVNDLPMTRLLGTNGGIKNSTIVYVASDLHEQLQERIDCGRDKSVPLIPEKLEAYQALVCSGSIPVSTPHGIIVVPDCVTHFHEDIISIDDSETDEPVVKHLPNQEIELTESDGYGLMLPSLSLRWNEELGGVPGEYLSGVNLRGLPWVKGMVFPVDFLDFAENVAHNYMVQDVWGDWRDVRDAELILTASQLKLWNCYSSFEEYWENVEKYHYQIAVAKTAPEKLEDERLTNYQFLQNYHLSDEEIEELCKPTIDEIKEVMGGDYRKALLYLNGDSFSELSPYETNFFDRNSSYQYAPMIDPETIHDPFILDKIKKMIKKKINQGKIGAIKLHANYAIIGGDPYSLMQSIFGLPVTGILKKGECYHKYWSDQFTEEICVFRAPMTSKYNIRKLRPVDNKETRHWFQYIKTCMLLNSWDSTAEALNGSDKDGDLYYTTDNKILLRHTQNLPAIFCIQRKGTKKIVSTEDLIKGNKGSFGDMIGHTTNIITSQICLQANFPEDSEEYKQLEYRIITGQHYQQVAIDKAKGIIAKPMPRYWYEYRYNRIADDDSEEERRKKEFNQRILAEKKPYFFIYNYPSLMKELRDYNRGNDIICRSKFGCSLEELQGKEDLTEEESQFLWWYEYKYPVERSNCIINKICWLFEREFKNVKIDTEKKEFDYSIYKSSDAVYTDKEYKAIENIYKTFSKFFQKTFMATYDKQSNDRITVSAYELFIGECYSVVSNEEALCNIMVEVCYRSKNSKQMVWDLCGKQILQNLLDKNDHKLSVPVRSEDGEFEYRSKKYTMVEATIEGEVA